jgi:hypothetical protein
MFVLHWAKWTHAKEVVVKYLSLFALKLKFKFLFQSLSTQGNFYLSTMESFYFLGGSA